MANLNLSEFTEKLFVADADHTFIWDTQNAISKRVSRNSWLNSGTLTSDAPVTISQTWNNAAVAFNALVVNAAGTSGTNSSSGSLLLNLQVNTSSAFFVRKDGSVYGSGNAVFASSVGVGSFGSTLSFYAGVIGGGRSAVSIANGWSYAFSSGAQAVASQDVFLTRDDVGTLALRNSTSAQTFRIYNTYSNAGADYERGEFVWSGSTFYIQTINLGSGQTRPLSFGGQSMAFRTNSGSGLTERMAITTAGNVGIGTTAPAGVLDIRGANTAATGVQIGGTSAGVGNYITLQGNASNGGSCVISTNYNLNDGPLILGTYLNRTNQLFLATNGNVGIGTTSPTSKLHVAGDITSDTNIYAGTNGYLFVSGRSAIGSSIAGGHTLLDNAGSFYNRLNLGGNTNLFPAIKRVGAELQIVIASTTSAAGVAAPDADMAFIEDRYRRKGAGSPNGAVTAPVGAVYHCTDGGANTSFYVKESGTGNTGWVAK